MEDTVPFAVTPATWEVEVGGSQSEAGLKKQLTHPSTIK
jgi:hypothetical protein